MADINSPKEYLQEALQLIDELDADRAELERSSADAEQLGRALDTFKKNIENEKRSTVSSRRADVENEYNKKLKAKNSEIDKLTDKRSKARRQGVNDRVAAQTAGFKDDIRNLNDRLHDYCVQNKLPLICRTKLFYKLYYPAGITDWLLVLIIVILMAAAIVGAFMYGKLPVMIAALVIDILIIAIYAALWSSTKGRYHEQLKVCKQIVGSIRQNKKGVKSVTKNIRSDKSDEEYDLGAFDSEISARKSEYDELQAQKTAALYQFDNTAAGQLTDEIDAKYAERLASDEQELGKARALAEELKKKTSAEENRLNAEYVQYLGSRGMTHEAVTEMIELITSGEAVSVSDAVAKLDSKQQK